MEATSIRAIMSSPVITVRPDMILGQVRRLMHEHHIRHLPVVDQGRLIGILTLRDLWGMWSDEAPTPHHDPTMGHLDDVPVAAVRCHDVVTVEADRPLAEAARVMLTHQMSGLPVMAGGSLVGIVTERDICRSITDGEVPHGALAVSV